MPLQIEELSVWKCVFCQAENDHTNPTRCWKCNKKKSKPSTVKRILSKRKKEEQIKKAEVRQSVVDKIDYIEPVIEQPLMYDLSKLE